MLLSTFFAYFNNLSYEKICIQICVSSLFQVVLPFQKLYTLLCLGPPLKGPGPGISHFWPFVRLGCFQLGCPLRVGSQVMVRFGC